MHTALFHRASECAHIILTAFVILEIRPQSVRIDILSLAWVVVRVDRDVRP